MLFMRDKKLFLFVADKLEKAGDYYRAWEHVVEIAQSSPPGDPIHDRLLTLEQRMHEEKIPTPGPRPRL